MCMYMACKHQIDFVFYKERLQVFSGSCNLLIPLVNLECIVDWGVHDCQDPAVKHVRNK